MTLSRTVAVLRSAGCVFAEDEARLLTDEAPDEETLSAWITRRVDGEPLEYIVGWAEFHGLRIRVSRGIFVPRRRTEAMVDAALDRVGDDGVLLDLCCGSGAVAAAVAHARPSVTVFASDIDPAAVECARRNLPGRTVSEGDGFSGVPGHLRGAVTVVTANTPYVPTDAIDTMPPEARDHEPRVTLDGGPDGLDIQRRLAAEAPDWLAPGGSLIVETSVAQADTASAIMLAAGLTPRVLHDDERDATIVIGTAGQG
ncbi:hypothetical protein ASG56_13745 [Rhodococcus sp. Leaf7]|uniref:putative protein N(5)-glutamine methyltransferase n=1 Tax=unclassified Rhodococcus (in: high G+C Gram-positive bacteria) TaxID=192944 RepID=UPI0006FBE1D3|nr:MULTISPECIES: putative protein N(5)-glutamine methyltransferase [unclassified Rhodococcus (in: high G+C Gram-positive bacteria)]KQU04411.1 hypothetical protein ASG56_13745 [Rhodococcus sp. Leaf7]KQU40596.1 hypothetical protein ASG64_13735 [Rhodococcus sp. Leaf247]